MSRTRSGAKKPKPATVAANTGVLRRSRRLSQSNTNGSQSAGPPGVRKNAINTFICSKPYNGAATSTPTCLPRRSQRLLQSNVKISYRFPSGCGETAKNTPETTTTTVLRRSQRLLQSKTVSFKSHFLDGDAKQGCDLFKKSSVRRLRKTTLPVNIGAVRLNFDDVGTVKCNNPIENNGGGSERRITHSLSASIAAQKGQRKSGSKRAEMDVGVQQGRESIPLSSLAVNIGKIIEQDEGARKSGVGKLEETFSELDSPPVSLLEKRCIRKTSKCKKRADVKRKQKQSDDAVQGTDCGWTKEQENALQSAYFAAKPTPNFWKRVARLVPGKSSQECFDKVNSENLTPRVPQPRSRCKRKALSPQLEISFSESELPKGKRKSRRKNHINQKTVRNLMRKNSHIEPHNKADFFSVLEPMVNPLPEALPLSPVFSTPTGSAEKGSSSRCRSHSFSNQEKSKTRFSSKSIIPITSPPILKPVRNMALHDKYVDQLHAREAKRKTTSTACNKRSTLPKGDVIEPLLKNKDVVRAAKESLLTDAKDVINKFRCSEMYIENFNDSEEDYYDEDEDDENAL